MLDALFQIHDRQDDSLSFRYSCRGAVCGSCAMLINKVPRLACRTQIAGLIDERPAEARPLPFHRADRRMGPGDGGADRAAPQHAGDQGPGGGHGRFLCQSIVSIVPTLQAGGRPEKGNRSWNRKRCMSWNSTPTASCAPPATGHARSTGSTLRYLGPAALAKLYRFHIDPRDRYPGEQAGPGGRSRMGWWACRFYTNCNKVCPKDVPPNLAIGKARQELKRIRKRTERRT